MITWEYKDLVKLRSRTAYDRVVGDADSERLVVLPGLELTQARKKPKFYRILVWCQCFARYTAVMASKFPECAPGFMSHQLTVLKAHAEVDDPAWRIYDEAFRDKMASVAVREWKQMDVALYQEICGAGGRQRKQATQVDDGRGARVVPKRPGGLKRPPVCWPFNDGQCSFGRSRKFPHECEHCRGSQPKSRCPIGPSVDKRQKR